MTMHTLKLATEPFEAIKSNKKTIESRLYDEKRKLIELGDSIEFINRESPDNIVRVKVVGLLRFESFKDLFENNNPSLFGGESVDWLMKQINEFYTLEEQEQYGVVGIFFKTL